MGSAHFLKVQFFRAHDPTIPIWKKIFSLFSIIANNSGVLRNRALLLRVQPLRKGVLLPVERTVGNLTTVSAIEFENSPVFFHEQ